MRLWRCRFLDSCGDETVDEAEDTGDVIFFLTVVMHFTCSDICDGGGGTTIPASSHTVANVCDTWWYRSPNAGSVEDSTAGSAFLAGISLAIL